jgi:predicted RNA-binding protein with PIN domain
MASTAPSPAASLIARTGDTVGAIASRVKEFETAPPGGPPTLGEVRWLVDGINVIGSRPDGWWRDRHAAMARLVGMLERFAEETGDDVAVVFEQAPSPPISSDAVEVAHAPRARPDAADDEIVRRLEAEPHPEGILVVTSDRRLAGRARAAGADVEPSSSFRRRIEEEPG